MHHCCPQTLQFFQLIINSIGVGNKASADFQPSLLLVSRCMQMPNMVKFFKILGITKVHGVLLYMRRMGQLDHMQSVSHLANCGLFFQCNYTASNLKGRKLDWGVRLKVIYTLAMPINVYLLLEN